MLIKYLFLTLILTFSLPNCSFNQNLDRVPNWSKNAVWYQIFPERFNNGDRSNDPFPTVNSWPYEIPEGWQIHPWTSDWYKLQPWEENGHDFYWNVQVRRYGGDLQGVIDKLDYLQSLGINAIYFNPLFESPSLHKYDATFYHHIDNNFGPDPKKDEEIWSTEDHGDPSTWKWTTADKMFLQLIKEAHERDIKIIIDGVFNHVGRTFWAFEDLVEKQEKSKYKNWFMVKSYDNPTTTENEFDYEGWYGAMDLPEILEDENGLIEDASKHVHDIVKRWMDPNKDGDPSDGIDGWRLDVAEMVNQKFWQKFRTWVKDINPEAYITGEIWWDDWNNNKMMNAAPWLKGDQFDAIMNYRFTRAVKHFISDQSTGISASAFADSINNIRKDYNSENIYALMNLLGSHDTERLASMIVNPDHWYDHGAVPSQREEFDVRKPNAIELQLQKIMIGIQMTMPGAPMIYYGDEAGMWGGDDPDCRKPMVWADKVYETETTHPYGKKRPADEVQFNSDLYNWYKKLIEIRMNNEVLRLGSLNFIQSGDDDILIYRRTLDENSIVVLVNNSDKIKEIEKGKLGEKSENLISNSDFGDNEATLILNPFEIAVYK